MSTITPEQMKFIAEAEAAEAQARLSDAQAREATARAVKAELELQRLRDDERGRLTSDSHHHLYQFDTDVDEKPVKKCMAQLRQWDRIDPSCPMDLIINSPGGYVTDGMALFDTITHLSQRGRGNHRITVGAQGYACSMGGILLQSGDHRWIGRQSYLMIHSVAGWAVGKIGAIADEVKYLEMIETQIADIFLERCKGKITRKRFLAERDRRDWWLTADDALKLGFVDEVR